MFIFVYGVNKVSAEEKLVVKPELTMSKHQGTYHIKTKTDYSFEQAQIWQLLKQYSSLRYLLPRVKKSQVVWEKDASALVYLLIDSPWPWQDIWTQVKVTQDLNNHMFQWQQQEGKLEVFSGKAWVLPTNNNKKHTTFHTEFKLNMGNNIPKLLQSWALRYYIPKILKQLANKTQAKGKQR
ncbi:hypothetical protein MRY82_09820 [bacterium]|nr:hypothetical protein [bacterium]